MHLIHFYHSSADIYGSLEILCPYLNPTVAQEIAAIEADLETMMDCLLTDSSALRQQLQGCNYVP